MYNKAKKALILTGVVDFLIAIALLLVFLFFLLHTLALFGLGDKLLNYVYDIKFLNSFLTELYQKVEAVWTYFPAVVAAVSLVATLIGLKVAFGDFRAARLDGRSAKNAKRKLSRRAVMQWFVGLLAAAALFAVSNFSEKVNIPFNTLLYSCIPSLVLLFSGFVKFIAGGIIGRMKPARYR